MDVLTCKVSVTVSSPDELR